MAGAPISAACEAHASFPHRSSSAANVEPESLPVSFWRSNLHILNNDAPCSSQGDEDLSSMANGGAGNSDAINVAASFIDSPRTPLAFSPANESTHLWDNERHCSPDMTRSESRLKSSLRADAAACRAVAWPRPSNTNLKDSKAVNVWGPAPLFLMYLAISFKMLVRGVSNTLKLFDEASHLHKSGGCSLRKRRARANVTSTFSTLRHSSTSFTNRDGATANVGSAPSGASCKGRWSSQRAASSLAAAIRARR